MANELVLIKSDKIKNIYSSGGYQVSTADKLFDDNLSTGWNSYVNDSYGNTFVTIELYKRAALQSIRIRGIAAISGDNYGLRDYKIFGSNDNHSFVELYNGSHANNNTDELAIINSKQDFQYYKFESLNSWYGNGKRVALSEIDYYVKEYFGNILFSSNNKTYSIKAGSHSPNLIPKMTSYTAPSGIVSTSSASLEAWRAFDQNDSHWLTGNVGGKATLVYQFPIPTVVSAYSLRYYASYLSHTLASWTFEGSDNGENWVVLDVQQGVSGWVADTKKIFSFWNKQSFLHYRLNITATSSNTYVALGEMEMLKSNYRLIEHSEVSEDVFIEKGMVDLHFPVLKGMNSEEIHHTALGSGKTFEHTVDLSKRRVDKIVLE